MDPIRVALVIFGCVFGGALLGMALRRLLPTHHLDNETRDLVKLAVGLVGTMAALVLGLLVASTKAAYDTHRTEVTQIAANVILLDRVLAHYGPEAGDARAAVRAGVKSMLDYTWAGHSGAAGATDDAVGHETAFDRIQSLVPGDDAHKMLQSQATTLAVGIGQTRWLLFAQRGSSIAKPFLVVVVSWLTLLSVSFGLFAPRNGTAVATVLMSAMTVSAAMYLILELDQPFSGLMRLSDEPLRAALQVLGR